MNETSRPCGFCGIDTYNPHGFCSDECFESHEAVCEQLRDDEPADIDSDFGYDPYAGGPEVDECDFGNYDSFGDDGRYDE